MKKKYFLIIIGIIILSGSFFLGIYIGLNYKKPDNTQVIDYAYTINTKERSNCVNNVKLYYQNDNTNIYTYCLDSININDGANVISFKDYLKENNNLVEEVINTLTYETSLWDGGTSIYRDNGTTGFTNNGLTIIKCNTLAGNKDIYIGPLTMNYQDGYCQDISNQFIRTYRILNIADSNDYEYIYLTVRQFQCEEVVTVKVPRNLASSIQAGKNYEFLFQTNTIINDNISSIFENATLISINETSKIGLNQTQDSID